MKKKITLLSAIIFTVHISAAVLVQTGGKISHPVGIIEVNGDWTNNGLYTQTAGVLKFVGSTDNILQKTGGETLNNITISKTGSAKVTLNSNLAVNGTAVFSNGNLITGNNLVNLGTTGSLSGENAAGYIQGTATLQRTVTTAANTLGNIGFSLGTGSNSLGTVSIIRKTGTDGISSINGDPSIARYWQFSSQNAISGSRTVTANWLSTDDNENTLTALRIWQSLSAKNDVIEKKAELSTITDNSRKNAADEKGWTAIYGPFNGSARTVAFTIQKNAIYTAGDAISTTLPFAENFEGSTFPPTGWTTSLAPNAWIQLAGSGVGASNCAKAAYTPAGTKILTMPSLDIPANYRLRFSWRNHDSKEISAPEKTNQDYRANKQKSALKDDFQNKIIGHDTTFCEISSDNTNWTILKIMSASAIQTTYTEEKIDLTPYAGTGRVIRWRYKTNASSSAYGSLLDNVFIEGIPLYSITPENWDYGSQQILDPALEKQFTITNTGIGTLKINSSSISGTNAADFALTDANSYPVSLSASQSMLVNVKFNPQTVGSKTAVLNINSDDKSIHTANLTGSAFDSTVTVFPYLQDFEAANFPPSGWDNSAVNGWAALANSGVGASKCARAFYQPASTRIITTPPVNLPSNKRLRFYWRNHDAKDAKIIAHDTTFCEISTNNTTWTVLKTLSAAAAEAVYKEEAVDLSSYAGSRIKLRWRYKGDGTNLAYSALLDNINIETPSGITESLIPKETKLYANYPNPFNNSTKIRYDLHAPANVSLKIYNYKGEEVLTLIKNFLPAGQYETSFNAAKLASGVYFSVFKAGSYEKKTKMILSK